MRKNIRNFVVVLFMAIICLNLTACSDSSKEVSIESIIETVSLERADYAYDELLYEFGEEQLSFFEAVPGRTYAVSFKDNTFKANINGEVQEIVMIEPEKMDDPPKSTRKFVKDKDILEMANRSKGIVIDYISKSEILRDKEMLIEKIKTIPVMYGKSNTESCVAFYKDQTIFVDKKTKKDDICEWLFVHELVHYLCELTHGGAGLEDYPFSLFVETMTDLITLSMEPIIWDGIWSAYSDYYEWVLPYVGMYRGEAIDAYFYGHEKIWKKVGKDKFDLYVFSIDHVYDMAQFMDVPISWILVNNQINEWACSWATK